MSREETIDCSDMEMTHPIVRTILQYKHSGTVLDLGSGTGRHSIFLAKHGFDVTALDINSKNLEVLADYAKKEGLKIRTIHNDIFDFGWTQNYDVIIATMSLHFLLGWQIAPVMAVMQSHTKLHGLNAISVHTDKNQKDSRPYLFKENELKGYYNNPKEWNIIEYKELLGMQFKVTPDGAPTQKYRAQIVVQKIS